VALSITQANGDLATIDPLQRDSELPSAAQPALVELGVLQGGKRVLFAVEPGVSVSGPGTCVPGPLDCQILALSVNETEGVQVGPNSQSLPFSVTGISVVNHPSVAAANLARRDRSAAGYALVQASARSAGSMFPYEASLGVVVDLRNLTVGGH
jgi:hypothetical protein